MDATTQTIVSTIEKASDIAASVSMALIILMILLVVVTVVARYLFKVGLLFSDEMSSYMLAGVTFLGLAYTLKAGGHLSVDVITDRLHPRSRSRLKFLFSIIALAWAVPLFVGISSEFYGNLRKGVVSASTLMMPLWVLYLPLVVGSALLLMQALAEIIKTKGTSE